MKQSPVKASDGDNQSLSSARCEEYKLIIIIVIIPMTIQSYLCACDNHICLHYISIIIIVIICMFACACVRDWRSEEPEGSAVIMIRLVQEKGCACRGLWRVSA